MSTAAPPTDTSEFVPLDAAAFDEAMDRRFREASRSWLERIQVMLLDARADGEASILVGWFLSHTERLRLWRALDVYRQQGYATEWDEGWVRRWIRQIFCCCRCVPPSVDGSAMIRLTFPMESRLMDA